MQSSDIPGPTLKFGIPFANGADSGHRTVPIPTATTGTYRASMTLGYPPETFLDPGAGGTPPDGRDFNGILFQISAWTRWAQAGGSILSYDAAFSTAIGGYPAGAVLMSVPAGILWLSTADNNTTDPDGGSPANWEPLMPVKAPDPTDAGDDTNFITPAQLAGILADGIPDDAILNTNGSYPFPGFVLKWGAFSISSPGTLAVSFVTPFENNCWNVVAGGGPALTTENNNVDCVGGSKSVSGFTAIYGRSTATTGHYIAIGN